MKLTSLEMKKLQVELLRVGAAKAELEFKIEEHLENINRLKDHIQIQEEKEIELRKKLEENK